MNATTEKTKKQQRKPRSSTKIWHMLTNDRNMLYMLAAGMAMPPAGFRGKHYADTLDENPGVIPLFRDRMPAPTLEKVTSERSHLRPCIAMLDLSGITGHAERVRQDGTSRHVNSPTARRNKNDFVTKVPAPLPLTILEGLVFQSEEDLEAFRNAADEVSNVDLTHYALYVDESMFLPAEGAIWPPAERKDLLHDDDDKDRTLAAAQSLGGLLCMLYHAANRSDMTLSTFQLALGAPSSVTGTSPMSDPILAELPGWINDQTISENAHDYAKLYWGVVRALVNAHEHGQPFRPAEEALKSLEQQHDSIEDNKIRHLLGSLIDDMHGCLGMGSGTISELFDRHKGPLSRSLLILCLRDRSLDLIEFDQPGIGDAEYLLACILFGAGVGWLSMPRELRDPALSRYAMIRMAQAEHRMLDEGLSWKQPPVPVPLRALFTQPNGSMNQAQQEAALGLAKNCQWHGCLQTRITLPEGDGPQSFVQNGHELLVPGIAETCVELLDERFLKRLGQWPLPPHDAITNARQLLASNSV